jgi:ABC-type lipoprotein release transport system permease subunit
MPMIDVAPFVVVPFLLIIVTVLATVLPVRRVARLDPAVTLRAE